MTRSLTVNETNVLGHIVVDPESWWNHAIAAINIVDPEAALEAKVSRYQSDYDDAAALDGYKNRAERDAEESA